MSKPTTSQKNEAIKHAKSQVDELYRFGGCWCYNYESSVGRRQSTPTEFFSAKFNRTQTMIDKAREFLGLVPVQYDGGSWENYF